MNGYFRAKRDRSALKITLLELDEIEYVNEDGEVEPDNPRKLLLCIDGFYFKCPRCLGVNQNATKAPYCNHCGWDCLQDPSYRKVAWAA